MPPGWYGPHGTRARILDRDAHACRWPGGTTPATEVHHTRPGVEADHLLVSLCPPHHLLVTQAQAALARSAAPPPGVPGWLLGQASPPPCAAGDRPQGVTDRRAVTGAAGDRTPRVTTPGAAGQRSHLRRRAASPGVGGDPEAAQARRGGTRARA
jgi:hypothetical protein